MKIYFETDLGGWALVRIRQAIRENLPVDVIEVPTRGEADLVILYIIGRLNHNFQDIDLLKKGGTKVIVLQCALRSTRNPNTVDWIPLWKMADLVWSYYDLPALIREDGNGEADFNFFHSPLGTDRQFQPHSRNKDFMIVTLGRSHRAESLHEVWTAVYQAGFEGCHVGKVFDYYPGLTYFPEGGHRARIAGFLSQCHYVSCLRRKEGFELTAVEGLVCGTRPIFYDRPHYRNWFGDFGEYIPEGTPNEVIASLIDLFNRPVRKVYEQERIAAREKFNWETILKGLWERCL